MTEGRSESADALERLRSGAAAPPAPAESTSDAARSGAQAPAAPDSPEVAAESGPPKPPALPRRALAAPGELDADAIARHAALLRGERLAQARRERRRLDLSDALDRLGSPDLERYTLPLVRRVGRIIPAGPSPERADGVRQAHDARQQARQDRLRARRAASLAAAEDRARRTAEALEQERERERREAEERAAARDRELAAVQARLDREAHDREERAREEERRRRAAQLARRRRQELRRARRLEAERRRREAAEERERDRFEAEERRRAEELRRQREAEAAAERARVQAERRAREEAEAAERARLRAEAEEAERRRLEQERAEQERRRAAEEAERARREAERRRLEQERAEQERRRAAEEAERARREAEEAARAAAEAHARWVRERRELARVSAERALGLARVTEDRRRALAARAAEEAADRLARHQVRETRALIAVAREIEGPETVPSPADRPLLADPEEGLTDEQLLERARRALPEWRRRGRLATKADEVRSHAGGTAGVAPVTAGPVPVIPGYTPRTGPAPAAGPALPADRRRQALLTAAWLLFVAASAWGLGLAGLVPGLDALDAGHYRAAQDGLLGSRGSALSLFLLHPLVWPALWAATGVLVAHQWTRGQGGADRQRATGRPLAGALAALAAWFPLAILVPWGLHVLPWLVALALLLRVIRRLTADPARSRREALAHDGMAGLLAGTVLAGTPSVLAAVPAAWGVWLPWFPSSAMGVALLGGVLLVSAHLVLTDRGRVGLALGAAWTLVCLAIPRLLPEPLGAYPSAAVGLLAAFGGLFLLLVAVVRRSWVRQVEQDAERSAQEPTAG